MTSPSASSRLRRGAGVALLVPGLLLLAPPSPGWADGTPSPTMGATASSLAGLNAPVRDFSATVRDIVTTVESIDGTQTEKASTTKRTVILDSKVLFDEDRAALSGAARGRLRAVARQIVDSGADGTVQVDGYTDDQGSAAHGLVLSRKRAGAVRGVLAPLLAGSGVRIVTHGYGEARPRFPNTDKSGRAIPENQAKNRRVEITFTPRR